MARMDTQKRATVYFEPDVHRALRLKAAASDRSISDMVNDAVKAALAEDAEDLEQTALAVVDLLEGPVARAPRADGDEVVAQGHPVHRIGQEHRVARELPQELVGDEAPVPDHDHLGLRAQGDRVRRRPRGVAGDGGGAGPVALEPPLEGQGQGPCPHAFGGELGQ